MKRKGPSDTGLRAARSMKRCLQRFHAHVQRSRIVTEIESYRVKRHDVKKKENCTLCLESVKAGDKVAKLDCGHVFHCGNQNSATRSHGTHGKGALAHCRGIVFWLVNRRTCPNCRTKILPFTERITQNQRAIKKIHKNKWQLDFVDDRIRRVMFDKIAQVCVEAVKTYDSATVQMLSAEELYRYNRKTAAKVELALFTRSSNLEAYSDAATLKYRVLLQVESLLSQRIDEMKK